MNPFASQPVNDPTSLELAVVFGINNLTIMLQAVAYEKHLAELLLNNASHVAPKPSPCSM
jgi:hypothetical protein